MCDGQTLPSVVTKVLTTDYSNETKLAASVW